MKKIIVGLFSLLLFMGAAQAQVDSEKLAKLPKILLDKIGKDLPGWTQRSIKPIEGSENVIIEQWESGDVTVKVVVTEYKAKDDAVNAFKDFKSQLKTEEDAAIAHGRVDFRLVKDDLPFLGDGGFTWDIQGSEAAAFRKENSLVFVSIARRPNDYKDVELSKEFARRVVEALSEP